MLQIVPRERLTGKWGKVETHPELKRKGLQIKEGEVIIKKGQIGVIYSNQIDKWLMIQLNSMPLLFLIKQWGIETTNWIAVLPLYKLIDLNEFNMLLRS